MVMPARGRSGHTLAEMMVTIAVLGVLAMVAAPMLVQITNFWRLTSARNDIQRDVRVGLDTVDRFTRQARASTVVIDQVSGQPPYSRIVFTGISGQTVSFYQQGRKLFMTVGANVSVLSSHLAYVAFVYPRTDDTSLLSVAMAMQSSTYLGGRKALQLSTQKVRIMNQ